MRVLEMASANSTPGHIFDNGDDWCVWVNHPTSDRPDWQVTWAENWNYGWDDHTGRGPTFEAALIAAAPPTEMMVEIRKVYPIPQFGMIT